MRAFRLARHHLDRRVPRAALLTAVGDIGGAQAQVLSAAQISLWARVRDLTIKDLDDALWVERNLVKAWCMRLTLHLVPAKDLAVYVRGSARRAEKEIRWALRHFTTPEKLARILEAGLANLDEPITRAELARRVAGALGTTVRGGPYGGWGSERKVPCVVLGDRLLPAGYLLQLLTARAVICFGPAQGTEATFVRGDAWVRGWRDLPQERAEEELVRRYLRAYGPATPSDFVAWTRMTVADARAIWRRLERELAPVSVDGWESWILRPDLPSLLEATGSRPSVRILPYFDTYLMGHMEREHLVPREVHREVYRDQGWVAPVVLLDGRVRGVWGVRRTKHRSDVTVKPFGRLPSGIASRIRDEAKDLGRFQGDTTTNVTFALRADGVERSRAR